MAEKIREVTPTSDAISVRYPLLSKIKKDVKIKNREAHHKAISNFVKYLSAFFITKSLQKNKHPKHIFKDLTMCYECNAFSTRWQIIFISFVL